jgi:hypothetical protein
MTTLNEIRDTVEQENQKAEKQRVIAQRHTEQLGRRIVQNADTLALIRLRLEILSEGLGTLLDQIEMAENAELSLPVAQKLDHNLIQALMAHAPLSDILTRMVPEAEIEAFLASYPEEPTDCGTAACETAPCVAEATMNAAQVLNITIVDPACACCH